MITKNASAAQRSTVDTCRTLVIWCVFLSLGKEKFIFGELIGFVILVLGTLVYNEIIEVPIPMMNFNTKRNMARRENMTKQALLRGSDTATSAASENLESQALLSDKKLD